MRLAPALALVGLVVAGRAAAGTTCSGSLDRIVGGFQIDGCNIQGVNAKVVLRTCSPGQQCVVTGTLEHCRGIRGACGQLTHITDAHWGKPLPACTATDAATRADKWWSESGSVLVQGTIAKAKPGLDGPPYGATKIVMDMTTCGGGSAMAIDHVPDRWIGHYVMVSGTAMKGQGGWYIVANDVQPVNQ